MSSSADTKSSRSTFFRHRCGDRINLEGIVTIVACSHCVEKRLECRMLSLSLRCGNCCRDGVATCLPAHIPIPDFSGINRALEKLEAQENAVEAQMLADDEAAEVSVIEAQRVATAARERSRAARAKLSRLRKQRKLLKRKEQEIFDEGRIEAEELERLEELEGFNQEIASANPNAPIGAHVVDWSFGA
ncbi:hypothetical protein EJ02DRAFT_347058 [Clathrospora elynae]|uniref:Uncharacterized protein n=1 Tax=Clathrospora elynae TaxID=706981 RepID=A0A6A5SQE4_9PLEO|nr:hypothetical protein EJ02DRAFT_347058 [Clathrospora elynae]